MNFVKIGWITLSLFLGFAIFTISVFRTASARYVFSGPVSQNVVLPDTNKKIDYSFVYPGDVAPGDILWPIKATRDKLLLSLNKNHSKRSEIALLLSDKRLMTSKNMLKEDEVEPAVKTLEKSNAYFNEAISQACLGQDSQMDVSGLFQRLALASLAHYQQIDEMINISPEDARPKLIVFKNEMLTQYEKAKSKIIEKGGTPPQNPF